MLMRNWTYRVCLWLVCRRHIAGRFCFVVLISFKILGYLVMVTVNFCCKGVCCLSYLLSLIRMYFSVLLLFVFTAR